MIDTAQAVRPKAQARRQQILDAACACVRRAGFHGASMAEIAQAANLSVGQIYRYFENKEAIIAAIVDQDLAELREKFAEFADASEGSVLRAVAHCDEALDRNYEPDRAALMLEVLAEAARNPRVAEIVQEADKVERTLLHNLMKQTHRLDCSEAELNARCEVISMLFEGMVMRSVNNPGGDRAAICDVLRPVLLLLLSNPPLDKAEAAQSRV